MRAAGAMEPGDVRVVAVDLDHAIVPEGVLSPDEQARAARFVFACDARRFAAARAALRVVLARNLGTDAARVRFRYGPRGRPEIDAPTDLRFSLSHSQGLALVAVTRDRGIGIDVERVRPVPDVAGIVERNFTPRERAAFAQAPGPLRTDAFLRAWVRKEAVIKAAGLGVDSLDAVEVPLEPCPPVIVGAPDGTSWVLIDLAPPESYVGALALSGPAGRLACRRPSSCGCPPLAGTDLAFRPSPEECPFFIFNSRIWDALNRLSKETGCGPHVHTSRSWGV